MPADVPVHDGLFEQTADGPRLVGGRCPSCHRHLFPNRSTCTYCSSDGVEEVRLSPEGTLWAWTAVTAAPPGYRGEVPYGFGVVELPEGIRVLTRLSEADPSRLRSGQPMHLELVALHTDDGGREVTSYSFAPLTSAENEN